jgi:glycosyltransferase involved in cell wall biosynthesis
MIAYTFYEGDNRVMRYAETLAARGDQVDVISVGKAGQPHGVVLNGVQVYRIQTREKNERHQLTHLLRILLFLMRASIVVARKHADHRYDVVHVHSVPDFLVFAASIPRLTGARVILDIHDLMPELYASKFGVGVSSPVFRALRIVEQISAACANHVIAPNHLWSKKLVQRSVSQSKCSVFMNYPDPALFSRRGRTRDESKIILLYPGTLNWHQGLDIAIRAFAENAGLFPMSEFHIYGEGPEKDNLIQLASQVGVGNRVLFHAPCPLREIAVISENSDLGIIPKRSDGFGDEAFSTKSLEFMMLGVPIIISKTKVDLYYFNPDVVTFVDSNSVIDLAGAMRRLMESKPVRRAQAERAARFVEDYAWSAHRDDYLNLVDQLVQRDPPATSAPVSEAEPNKVS